MGKSLGNTLDPFALVNRNGADAVRYYFIKEIEFGRDGDFNETRFVNILNADLANDLGNLLNRTLGMIHKYCQGVGPQLTAKDISSDNSLKSIGLGLGDRARSAYDELRFTQVCEEVFILIRAGNKFIDESAPWSLFKQGKLVEVKQVLYSVLESVRLAAYLLSPIIPNISSKIYQQLSFEIDFTTRNSVEQIASFKQHIQWGSCPSNHNLKKPQPIFAKLELP
jgi:methionyl-tRNA synthetase